MRQEGFVRLRSRHTIPLTLKKPSLGEKLQTGHKSAQRAPDLAGLPEVQGPKRGLPQEAGHGMGARNWWERHRACVRFPRSGADSHLLSLREKPLF